MLGVRNSLNNIDTPFGDLILDIFLVAERE